MKKKCQVILLKTNEKSNLFLGSELFIHSVNNEPVKPYGYLGMHLYVLSNDVIANGDWILYFKDRIFKVNNVEENCLNVTTGSGEKTLILTEHCRKIIATTDKSCKTQVGVEDISHMPIFKYLPEPSSEFIEEYVKEYNSDNKIELVYVEYEERYRSIPSTQTISGYVNDPSNPNLRIKINSNNTINITKAKDSWNRKELELIMQQYGDYVCNAVIEKRKPHYKSSKEYLDDFAAER